MAKYIVRDIASVMRYLPYGLVAGMIVAIILSAINDRRVKKNKIPFSVPAITGLIMYIVVMLFITFLSREDGSSMGIDLELFSTWGINTRNNAYVIENILLFIPYGLFCAWAFPAMRSLLSCTLSGAIASLGIECLQLVTGRGFFQIDDVITNTLGALVGYVVYRCMTNKIQRALWLSAILLITVIVLYIRATTGHSPLDWLR